MSHNHSHHGFTLIEILVSVAIIGTITTIVVGTFNNVRTKAADVAIRNNLSNVRASAELTYRKQFCYGDDDGGFTCAAFVPPTTTPCTSAYTTENTVFKNTSVQEAIEQARKASGGTTGLATCRAGTDGTSWAVAVVLKSDKTKAWCVDSSGASKEIASTSGAAYNQNSLNGGTGTAANAYCE